MTDSEIPKFINPSLYSRTIANSFYSFLSVVVVTTNEFYLKMIIAKELPLSRMICVWQMKTLAGKKKKVTKPFSDINESSRPEVWLKQECLYVRRLRWISAIIFNNCNTAAVAMLYLSHTSNPRFTLWLAAERGNPHLGASQSLAWVATAIKTSFILITELMRRVPQEWDALSQDTWGEAAGGAV